MTQTYDAGSRTSAHSKSPRRYTPWIKSPLHPTTHRLPRHQSAQGTEKIANETLVDSNEHFFHEDNAEIPIFRKHHEASTLELYYDLYFVANLSIFAADHDIYNVESVSQRGKLYSQFANVNSSRILYRILRPTLVRMAPELITRCSVLDRLRGL
jgi:hypothetical protein